MSVLRLALEPPRTWCRPGERVAGRASWHPDGTTQALEVRLFWHTRGTGIPDVVIVGCLRVERPAVAGERDFAFDLPPAPYSFSGRLITLGWALELVALPSEEAERLDLVVGPRPVEVDITTLREG
jgi:hypothetical protein